MDMYEGYHFWGMHLIWWVVWGLVIFWIYAIPYRFPGQRSFNEMPLEILKRRLALGEISKEEYLEKKELLLDQIRNS